MAIKIPGRAVHVASGSFTFLRYSLVGLLATCVQYALLMTLVELAGAKAALSAVIGATCGALTAYAGNRRFTFSSRTPHGQAFPRFGLIAALGAISSGTIVWTGSELFQMHYVSAQLIATALILCVGFVLNRRWVFA